MFLLLYSCGDKECGDDIPVDENLAMVEIQRLEDDFFQLSTYKDAVLFLDNNPAVAEAFFQRSQYPHDSIIINRLLKLSQNPYLDTIRLEVNKEFGQLTDITLTFTQVFNRIKYYYPDFKAPMIKTMITGLADGGDIIVTPDVILIGLDWFLGRSATYKPSDVPAYILERMQKDYLVPTAILFLSNAFNATKLEDKSMLAEMIYYGKAYAFTRKMLPCVPDSILLGYTNKELEGINFNEERIWAHFVNESLLYENNHFIKVKYLNERPNVPEIGDDCPGRIGRWLGWEIIKAYEGRSKEDFVSMMNNTDVANIFMQSKYRPNPH